MRTVLALTVVTTILTIGLIMVDVVQTTVPHAARRDISAVSNAIILLVFGAIGLGIISAIRR
jgi:hypothetical protein